MTEKNVGKMAVFDFVLCKGRELAAPRGYRKVVGLMPGLCAALCGFGLLSLRVPGFPPGFLTPAKDSHTRMIGSSAFFLTFYFLSVSMNASERRLSVFLIDGKDTLPGL